MKRKLIAIALACAMVFSMIPSLAFADVATDSNGVPTYNAVDDLIYSLEAYGADFGKMTIDNYKTVNADLTAAEDAIELLEEMKANADGDYTAAQEKAAGEVYARLGSGVASVQAMQGAYDTRIAAIVDAEILKLDSVDKYYFGTETKALAPLYEALDTIEGAYTLTGQDTLTAVELAVFISKVYKEITYDFDFTTAGEFVLQEDAEKVVIDGDDLAAAAEVYATGNGQAVIDAIKAVEGKDKEFNMLAADTEFNAIENAYEQAVINYNAKAVADYNAAMTVLSTNAGNVVVDIVKPYIDKAREAYAKFVGYEPADLEDLQGYEAAYVNALLPTDACTDETVAKYVAALDEANAAYEKYVAFYEANEEESALELAAWTDVADAIDAAYGDLAKYYENEASEAYAKVKAETAVTDENRENVAAFVNAYEAYVATLSVKDKEALDEAVAKGTDKMGVKYAELKAALDAVIAEEEQAKADEAAKIAILSTKVKNVKAVAGKKKATIKWAKNDAADGYKVMRANSKNGKFKAVKKNTTKVKFVNKKLKSGKTYYYKVVAYKTIAGKKVWSKDSKIIKVKVK